LVQLVIINAVVAFLVVLNAVIVDIFSFVVVAVVYRVFSAIPILKICDYNYFSTFQNEKKYLVLLAVMKNDRNLKLNHISYLSFSKLLIHMKVIFLFAVTR